MTAPSALRVARTGSVPVRVIGRSAAAADLAAHLAVPAVGGPTHSTDVQILASWAGRVHLLGLAAQLAGQRWILVEATGKGAALGPVFGPTGPCLLCYLRRLAANGRPVPVPLTGSDTLLRGTAEVARELIAGAHGDDAHIEISRDGTLRRHTLLAVPGCSCPAGPTSHPLEAAVGDRVGIVHSLTTSVDDRSGHTLVDAVGCRTGPLHDGLGWSHGSGCAPDPDTARRSAIGECLERYCAGFAVPGAVIAARKDLEGPSVPADEAAYGGHHVSDRTPLRWIPGVDPRTGGPIWAAAASVHLPYRCADEEPPASHTSSEGLAAGPSTAFALRRATLEMIERDAFMRAWRGGTPVGRIRAGVPDMPGLSVAGLTSACGVPVAVAFLEQDVPPYTAVGLAARLSVTEAAQAASREAVATRIFTERMLAAGADARRHPPTTPAYHRYVHAVDARLYRARRRWVHPEHDYPSRTVAWSDVVHRLPATAYVDMTTRDAAALGCRVARVVIDGYVGLDTDATRPRLAGDPTPHPLA
ncbi:YcaO-like family protein [Embleya sp. NPDC001921]